MLVEMNEMAERVKNYDLYADIRTRTQGEIYLGVVGPVRTGKSTLIKRFMELCVLPHMEEYMRVQTMDELPQSGNGKMITTTEPKFIPKEAAKIKISPDVEVSVRMIDCVGFMVESALGFYEENAERMVKTPWTDVEIPFAKAAEIGTRKVITDHATIGIVVTTDGSITDIAREDYEDAEGRVIEECKELRKPYIVLLNSTHPKNPDTVKLAQELAKKYESTVLPMNCAMMQEAEVRQILTAVLYEFPLSVLECYTPKWLDLLPMKHPMKEELVTFMESIRDRYGKMRDVLQEPLEPESDYIRKMTLEECNMANGIVRFRMDLNEHYYYEILSEMTGSVIQNESDLLEILKEMGERKKEYDMVAGALSSVRASGYGVMTPKREEITLAKPELIRHGSKFGVKIRSNSPAVFLIRANIENEIAPIIGTQEQANDLIEYISLDNTGQDGMWDTNIFGKTVEQMVYDGITGKIAMIGEESQQKLQDTMQKIVNDMNGGMVCIII